MKKSTSKKRKIWILAILLILTMSSILIFIEVGKITPKSGSPTTKTDLRIPPKYEEAIIGLDISRYQGVIEWDKICFNNKIKFVYIKSTEGSTLIDPHYKSNIQKLNKCPNIVKGAYHYLNPHTDGRSQARFFIKNTIFNPNDLLPVLDIEQKHPRGRNYLIKVVNEFVDEFKLKMNLDLIIYSGLTFYKENLHPEFSKTNKKIWIAHYSPSDSMVQTTNWLMWQFTEKGRIIGINNNVDVNVFNGDSTMFNRMTIKCYKDSQISSNNADYIIHH